MRAIKVKNTLTGLLLVVVSIMTVLGSLGCIVFEEGGEELPEGVSDEDPTVDDPVDDEFADFEHLDPMQDDEDMPPDMDGGDAVDMGPVIGEGDFVMQGESENEDGQQGELVVLWYVTSGDVPYFYRYGGGSLAQDGSWIVAVGAQSMIPDEAFDEDGFATGMILALKPGSEQLAQDVVSLDDFRTLQQKAIGVSSDHALVFVRTSVQNSAGTWVEEFAQGQVVCGQARGDAQRGLEPVACESVVLNLTRDLSWVTL